MNNFFQTFAADACASGRDPCRLLVLGLGNPVMGDDGAGIELLHLVRDGGGWPESVVFEDGGTMAMSLLPLIEDARGVLFLDAMKTGAAPGSVLHRMREELPGFFSRTLSPHELGLHEVLGAAQLRGTLPPFMEMVGIEAEDAGFARPMSPPVRVALEAAARLARERIAAILQQCGEEGAHA
jgi:hydrogenase maturation protease